MNNIIDFKKDKDCKFIPVNQYINISDEEQSLYFDSLEQDKMGYTTIF